MSSMHVVPRVISAKLCPRLLLRIECASRRVWPGIGHYLQLGSIHVPPISCKIWIAYSSPDWFVWGTRGCVGTLSAWFLGSLGSVVEYFVFFLWDLERSSMSVGRIGLLCADSYESS
ncbi:hypothetical protein ABKN59_007756 [Abortiporus biennis]